MSDDDGAKAVKFTADYSDTWTTAFFTCLIQTTGRISNDTYRQDIIFVVSDGAKVVHRPVSLYELDETIKMLKAARKAFVTEKAMSDKLKKSSKSKKVQQVD
jgi:hypothetical protein